MDGDTPLDMQCWLCDIATKRFPEAFAPAEEDDGPLHDELLTAEHLNACQQDFIDLLNDEKIWSDGWDQQIFGHVWAWHVMRLGAEMTDKMRENFMRYAMNDAWAKEPGQEDRAACCLAFANRIRDYNGTPVEGEQKGLFGSIAEKMAGD
jgi:hypothetical protein